MNENKKIINLIKSQKECGVALYGKIFRCKINSYTQQKNVVLIEYDFTNTGKNYYYTSVPIKNLIL